MFSHDDAVLRDALLEAGFDPGVEMDEFRFGPRVYVHNGVWTRTVWVNLPSGERFVVSFAREVPSHAPYIPEAVLAAEMRRQMRAFWRECAARLIALKAAA